MSDVACCPRRCRCPSRRSGRRTRCRGSRLQRRTVPGGEAERVDAAHVAEHAAADVVDVVVLDRVVDGEAGAIAPAPADARRRCRRSRRSRCAMTRLWPLWPIQTPTALGKTWPPSRMMLLSATMLAGGLRLHWGWSWFRRCAGRRRRDRGGGCVRGRNRGSCGGTRCRTGRCERFRDLRDGRRARCRA